MTDNPPEDEPCAEERFERGIHNALNWTIRNWGEIEMTTSIGEFSPIYLPHWMPIPKTPEQEAAIDLAKAVIG